MTPAETTAVEQNWRDIEVGTLDLPEAIRLVLMDNDYDTLGTIVRNTNGGADMSPIRTLPGMIPDAVNDLAIILDGHRAAESDGAGQAADDSPGAADADTADAGPPATDADDLDALQREVEVLREHDQVARFIANEAEQREIQWTALKEQAAVAKKELDLKLTELRRHAQSRPSYGPLFDGAKDAAPAETPADPVAEAWRDATLEDLGITGKVAELLAENDPPLTTQGAIGDYTIGHKLTDIRGIGQAKATQIEDALVAHWAEHDDGDADPGAATNPKDDADTESA